LTKSLHSLLEKSQSVYLRIKYLWKDIIKIYEMKYLKGSMKVNFENVVCGSIIRFKRNFQEHKITHELLMCIFSLKIDFISIVYSFPVSFRTWMLSCVFWVKESSQSDAWKPNQFWRSKWWCEAFVCSFVSLV
jgi:hypothetical protein